MINSQRKIGVILSYVGIVFKNLLSLIFTPIVLRFLGQSEYGLYQLVVSIISNLAIFNTGFASSYVRFYAIANKKRNQEEVARLNGTFMSIYLCMALVITVVGTIFVLNLKTIFAHSLTPYEISTARILFILFVFNTAISFPTVLFTSNMMVNERFGVQRGIDLIFYTLLTPLLTLPLLFLGFKSIALVMVNTIANLSVFAVSWFYCKKRLNIRFSFRNQEKKLYKTIAVFSFFIFVTTALEMVNLNLNKFFLTLFGGTVVVAVFSVGTLINQYYTTISASVVSVFTPRVNEMVVNSSAGSDFDDVFCRIGRIQFLILGLVLGGFILVGQYFIGIWVGPDYAQAYYITLFLIIPATVPMIQNIGVEIMRAKNMHKFGAYVYIGIFIFNVLLSLLFIRFWGMMGAAAATGLSILLGNGVVMNWFYKARLKLNVGRFWKEILKLLPPAVLATILGYLLRWFIPLHSFFRFLLVGGGYVCLYVGLMWPFGMNAYEKSILKKPVRKLFSILQIKRGLE